MRTATNFSVYLASKLRGIKVVAVVTDLPGEGVASASLIHQLKKYIIFALDFDFYVCLTDELDKYVNKNNKPSAIIEGFTDKNLEDVSNNIADKFEERVLVYAGGVHERYGIKDLIEGFQLLPQTDVRLWIYGFGPFTSQIDAYTQQDSRILYKGFMPNAELLDVLHRATLLVNPRPTHEDFTKYSFPSKNLEYMSTGTPLLTTKLPGIPHDHYPYIFFINDESAAGIHQAIADVLSKIPLELHNFGKSAKDFALLEKNNVRQAGKIIDLVTCK